MNIIKVHPPGAHRQTPIGFVGGTAASANGLEVSDAHHVRLVQIGPGSHTLAAALILAVCFYSLPFANPSLELFIQQTTTNTNTTTNNAQFTIHIIHI
jgi:hypothetical protein